MSLIDSHCHLYYEPFINNIQSTINECKINHVISLLSISVDLNTSLINTRLANTYSEIYCSIGIHPNEVSKTKIETVSKLEDLFLKSRKVLAIGEIGLDYFRNNNKSEQINYFEKQIELSLKLKLPIIVHTRNSDDDLISIIKEYSKYENIKFLIHCFTGDLQFSKFLLDLGCYISLSGVVTFKNAHHTHEVASYVPLDKLLVETDSPYLSPHPFRGNVNYPKNVILVAKKIAEIKKLKIEVIEKYTTENFYKFFNLKK